MKIIALLTAVMLWMAAYSQNKDVEIDIQRISEDLLAPPQENVDYEDLYENTMQIMSAPFDLNKITRDELKLLHVLSDRQIENFIAYRDEQGYILDVHELQVIPGMDPDLISKFLPFVAVKDPGGDRRWLQRLLSPGHSYFVARYGRTLETEKGFSQSHGNPPVFRGSPDKLYMRLRSVQTGDYSIGFTAEKDAGEKLTLRSGEHPVGFDYTSFHVQLQRKGKLKNLIVGDFQTQFAQGLLLGGAFGLGKGSETVSTARKSNAGFLPYTSINESAYLRGVAFTAIAFSDIDVSVFYSRVRRDATQEGSADTVSVTSFQTSGFHRTDRELSIRKKVMEESSGLVLRMNKKHLDAGFTIHAIHFGMPVRRAQTLYNQFAFAGPKNINVGVFLNYSFENLSFFSEAGRSLSGGAGAVLGMLMTPYPKLDIAVVYRNYGRGFHTFNSNGFSENTQPSNERGIYWGWKYRWNRQHTLSGYADLFSFPWLGYRRYAPAVGYEWFMRANYAPSRKVSLSLQVREESKPRNIDNTTALYQLRQGLRRNISGYGDYGVGENIRLRWRLQYNSFSFSEETTEGIALIQDISIRRGRLKFTGRHALFDAEHFDNRQYAYEQDAWLAYSLPAYSGVGVRNYALFEFKVHKQVTVWLRYARTRLTAEGEIGSGPNGIAGNTRNDVKFQARFNF